MRQVIPISSNLHRLPEVKLLRRFVRRSCIVYTFTGSNEFTLGEAVRNRVAEFIEHYGDLGIERLDGATVSIDRIREAVHSVAFLSAKKLIIIDSLSAHKQAMECAEELCAQMSDDTDSMLLEPKLDKRSSYYKYLKANTQYQEFTDLRPDELAQWLVRRATEGQSALKPTDARYLIERVGAKQQLLAQELNKLLIGPGPITRERIDSLTESTPQSTVFQLLEAAFAGRTAQALQLYREQRQLGTEPAKIVALLGWQLHIVALIKTAGTRSANEIAAEAKISPYVIAKSQSIAHSIRYDRLRQLISELTDIDVRSKRVAVDLDDALQRYLLQLTYSSKA